MAPFRHFFTPREANDLLPRVRTLVARIVQLKQEALARKQEMEHLARERDQRRYGVARRTYLDCAHQMQAQMDRLEALGCYLKDADVGLLDFPAKRFGEDVWLCWKLGEPAVTHWHGMTEGFRGRKPLEVEAKALA